MTRKEFFDHRFRIHGSLSDAIEDKDQKPHKYIQTLVFDSAFGSRPDGPLNTNHNWVGRDDTTELFFRDWDHVQKCFSGDYVKTTIAPDGPFVTDFETSVVLMAYEKKIPLQTAATVKRAGAVTGAMDSGDSTVAIYFIYTPDDRKDGERLEQAVTPRLVDIINSYCQDQVWGLICNVGAVSDQLDLNSYFGGANMSQYALVYNIFLDGPESVPLVRKAQAQFEKHAADESIVDLHKSFILFLTRGSGLDVGKEVRIIGQIRTNIPPRLSHLIMALPNDNTDDAPVSLSQPAPAGPIPTTAWHAYFSYGIGHLDYNGLVEQRTPCIRSLRHQWNVKSQFFLQPPAAQGMPQLSSNYEINETATFPYPKAYQELMKPIPRRDEEHGTVDGETSPTRQAQAERIEWKTTFSTPVFGIERTSAIEFESRIQPTYVVLGLYLRGNPNPKERVVFVDKPDQLFSKLRWATFRLRGMRGTLLSLKHLKGFRIYKCHADTGTHKRINLDDNGVADLQLFMGTYRRWLVPRHISLAWSDWIHCTLNNKRLDILEGEYGLELVLDWSVTRISIVVLVPVLLSLAIGIWLNSKAWTDLATIQTAWGTASYIVTAGALLAAMLGFLDIADK
ncbi:hypothetical protein FNAPI_6725 [Fusarium napiforme]|uniref:EthD domain-containing protein n=1 Tax=Fusarium napiforme TaxID=42672 RepID=A0A8H5N6G5_9HYPO|nr:hypothetical protein FNAPI_6725 [Fusarium napiforme]